MRILTPLLLLWTQIVIGQTLNISGNSARSPHITLNNQNISITPEKVKVISEYSNDSEQDITETFVFTNPINISVNLQPLQTQIMQHAINPAGRDVSQHLTALGLPFDPVAAMQTIDASSNRESITTKLLSLHLIDPKELIPNWTVKTYYYWQYTFPARSNTTIEHNHKPYITNRSVKLNTITSMLKAPINVMKKAVNVAVHWTLEDTVAAENLQSHIEKYITNIDNYCPSNNDYQTIALARRLNKNLKSQIETRSVSFKYNSEDLWAKPLDKFTLNIDSTDNMYPILCWHDKLQRDTHNSLYFTAENYVPMQDISVLYIER
jgi:hypothetical protein